MLFYILILGLSNEVPANEENRDVESHSEERVPTPTGRLELSPENEASPQDQFEDVELDVPNLDLDLPYGSIARARTPPPPPSKQTENVPPKKKFWKSMFSTKKGVPKSKSNAAVKDTLELQRLKEREPQTTKESFSLVNLQEDTPQREDPLADYTAHLLAATDRREEEIYIAPRVDPLEGAIANPHFTLD